MLEGIFEVGEQARLVQKLRPLELREATPEVPLGQLGNPLKQRERDVLADH